ncbi:MAG TPA: ATP-binding protein [Verrucomicrobiae bacterium]
MLAIPILAADPAPANNSWILEMTNHLGQWMWETNTFDKQTCRFWKSFRVPNGSKATKATLRITADNGYSLYLDGREIGRGSDWRSLTEYDVTRLLNPGRHILAVEGFNDRDLAGVILGLHIEVANGPPIDVVSDSSWLVVTDDSRNWTQKKAASPRWHRAAEIAWINPHPDQRWPFGLATEPPLRPIVVKFWQTAWFQVSMLTLLLSALAGCLWLQAQLSLQNRAQRLLQTERVRIARDIHDDLGAQLTQLVLFGEVAQREQPENSPARGQFTQICAMARALSHGMDEVVWAVNARRDTLRDFVNYVCKYAQVFLDATPIRCRLDVEPDLPPTFFDLPVRRNLFLAVKEALNNAAKHSQATELFVRIHRAGDQLTVTVEDNGRGFDPVQLGSERNGMANMTQRMDEIGGVCELTSARGAGCQVTFTVPMETVSQRRWFRWARRPATVTEEIS